MSNATDKIWKRSEIDSPCVKVCVIDPRSRLCTGCLRTIDEITQWSRITPDLRAQIMTELPSRKSQLTQRRGGRAGRLKH